MENSANAIKRMTEGQSTRKLSHFFQWQRGKQLNPYRGAVKKVFARSYWEISYYGTTEISLPPKDIFGEKIIEGE